MAAWRSTCLALVALAGHCACFQLAGPYASVRIGRAPVCMSGSALNGHVLVNLQKEPSKSAGGTMRDLN